MSILKKLIAMLLSCCFIFSATLPVMAAEPIEETTVSDVSLARSSNTNQFIYLPNNSNYNSLTFTTTKTISYFTYSTGAYGTSSAVMIKFTNVSTGSYCTHLIYGSRSYAKINCNLAIGTYKVTFVTNADAVGDTYIYFFN